MCVTPLRSEIDAGSNSGGGVVMSKTVRLEQHGPLGITWFMGWLFSVGYLKFGFWKGVLALMIWPYFLGAHFASEAPDAAPVIEDAR